MRKVAPTQRHFKDSSFDFSRQRSLWRGANNNNKNTRVHHHHHQRPAKPLPRYPTRRMVLPQSQSYPCAGSRTRASVANGERAGGDRMLGQC